jgi:hypothetical protein
LPVNWSRTLIDEGARATIDDVIRGAGMALKSATFMRKFESELTAAIESGRLSAAFAAESPLTFEYTALSKDQQAEVTRWLVSLSGTWPLCLLSRRVLLQLTAVCVQT